MQEHRLASWRFCVLAEEDIFVLEIGSPSCLLLFGLPKVASFCSCASLSFLFSLVLSVHMRGRSESHFLHSLKHFSRWFQGSSDVQRTSLQREAHFKTANPQVVQNGGINSKGPGVIKTKPLETKHRNSSIEHSMPKTGGVNSAIQTEIKNLPWDLPSLHRNWG